MNRKKKIKLKGSNIFKRNRPLNKKRRKKININFQKFSRKYFTFLYFSDSSNRFNNTLFR